MLRDAANRTSWLEWGVASRAMPGEVESGDRHVVAAFPQEALAAVVDGLGHGDLAALAAEAAVAALHEHARAPLIPLVQHCHEALRRTRGVVMSVAALRAADQTLTWLGVGDVEGILLHPHARRDYLLPRGGVVGYQLPPLKAVQLSLLPGDVLIFATDGVSSGFADELNLDDPPQQIADEILARRRKTTDDALALVVRYRGQPA